MKRILLCLLVLLTVCPIRAEAAQEGIAVGGIHILMTNVTGQPLSGAVFRIYREAEPHELTDQSVEKKLLSIGDEKQVMSAETFWDNRALTGEKKTSVTTDEEGRAAVYGLSYGTYYLVEETAPEGYNRITSPIRVTIHKYSHLTEGDDIRDDNGVLIDNTMHIINIRYTLPDTGNMETLPLWAAVVGLFFSGAALILLNRRRRDF